MNIRSLLHLSTTLPLLALLLSSGCSPNKQTVTSGTIHVVREAEYSQTDQLFGQWILRTRKVRRLWGLGPAAEKEGSNLEDIGTDFLELAAFSDAEAPRWKLVPAGRKQKLQIYQTDPNTNLEIIIQSYLVLKLNAEQLVLKQTIGKQRIISYYRRAKQFPPTKRRSR